MVDGLSGILDSNLKRQLPIRPNPTQITAIFLISTNIWKWRYFVVVVWLIFVWPYSNGKLRIFKLDKLQLLFNVNFGKKNVSIYYHISLFYLST